MDNFKNKKLKNIPMDYREILEIIASSAKNKKTVKIYYPKTENTKEGWREIEPYNIANDIGDEAEILVYGKDRLSPGHILNAFTIGGKDNSYHSFIIGKIKKAKKTNSNFIPRNNWKVDF